MIMHSTWNIHAMQILINHAETLKHAHDRTTCNMQSKQHANIKPQLSIHIIMQSNIYIYIMHIHVWPCRSHALFEKMQLHSHARSNQAKQAYHHGQLVSQHVHIMHQEAKNGGYDSSENFYVGQDAHSKVEHSFFTTVYRHQQHNIATFVYNDYPQLAVNNYCTFAFESSRTR